MSWKVIDCDDCRCSQPCWCLRTQAVPTLPVDLANMSHGFRGFGPPQRKPSIPVLQFGGLSESPSSILMCRSANGALLGKYRLTD